VPAPNAPKFGLASLNIWLAFSHALFQRVTSRLADVSPTTRAVEFGVAMTSKLSVVKSTPANPKTNRTTAKAVNDALRARGREESLRRGGPYYFYFGGGEAVHWLSSSVIVSRLSDLTVKQWIQEFDRLLANEKKLRKRMR
jgi:hypothetical protein